MTTQQSKYLEDSINFFTTKYECNIVITQSNELESLKTKYYANFNFIIIGYKCLEPLEESFIDYCMYSDKNIFIELVEMMINTKIRRK